MQRLNGHVRRWYAIIIDNILRDVTTVAVAGDLTGSIVPCAHRRDASC